MSPRFATHTLLYAGGDKTLADVKALLDAGAYANEEDWAGWTPLHHAAALRLAADANEVPEIIAALAEAGANPNARMAVPDKGRRCTSRR